MIVMMKVIVIHFTDVYDDDDGNDDSSGNDDDVYSHSLFPLSSALCPSSSTQ